MDLARWAQENRAHWVRRAPVLPSGIPKPRHVFGEEDAAEEWTHDNPQELFAPIESYREIKEHDALFLFGRRGTGKTAILRMLDYEVLAGRVGTYSSSQVLNPKHIIGELTLQIEGSFLANVHEQSLFPLLKKIWLWLLQSAGLVALARKEIKEAVKLVLEMLPSTSENALNDPDEVTKALVRLMKVLIIPPLIECDSAAQVSKAVHGIEEALFSGVHSRRCDLLRNVARVQERPVLVLVDTDEAYYVHDDLAVAVHSALLDAVLELSYSFQRSGLLAKAAFPSEATPHMKPLNKEKTEGKSVTILWRYRDLATFAAKRFLRAIDGSAAVHSYRDLDDYGDASSFMAQFMPRVVTTRTGVRFNTLAYIIRHTQKKPRQLIVLLNAIATLGSYQEGELYRLFGDEENIRNGVHVRLDMLVTGALDIYKEIYPETEGLVRTVLTGARSYFMPSELDKLLQTANPLRHSGGLSKHQLRRLLLEVGVLGVAREVNSLTPSSSIMEAMYEYQIKETLTITPDALCAVHPMFYEELRTSVDQRVFIYPKPFEDEEIDIIEFLRGGR